MLGLAVVAALFSQAPAGWKVRIDRSMAASDPDASGSIKFLDKKASFHASNPQRLCSEIRPIDGQRISLGPGNEYFIPRGLHHGGEVLAGIRTIRAFGGHRADRG